MRSRLALGALFVATTVSLTVTVTGLAGVTGSTDDPVGFLTPTASAAELVPFEDCGELRDWYVEQALPQVGPYGLGGWPGVLPTAALGTEGGAVTARGQGAVEDSTDAVESSGTGTNVQEVGVDEPDRAKTDGELVVHVRRNTLVVSDVSGSVARELGTLPLPRDLAAAELLLAGDTVLVIGPERSQGYVWDGPIAVEGFIGRPVPFPATDGSSRVLEVSIADPEAPRLVSEQTFGGRLVSARQYDDTVRLVLSTQQPVIDFVQPNRERTEKQATAENRRILRDSAIEDWLPTVRTGDGKAEPLVECADVRHPDEGAGYGTVSVVTFDAEDPSTRRSLAVTTSGETVYSSTDRLYLATWAGRDSTEVHAFALDGATTAYVASGKVPGILRDRWSLDEHDGVLRLALAHGSGSRGAENGITTLREDGEVLEVAGSVRGLGPDEEIKSVRWFDELAVVVTFRQTDPLYTVDLGDPDRPRTLGDLKIPGFSEYLHPIGDDLLLGLGQDATARGQSVGGQASLFDIADLSAPERLDTLALGRDAYPATGYDPRTFTWLDERGSGLAVVENHWNGRSTLVEVRVTPDGALLAGDSWPLARWDSGQARALPLPGGTSVAVVSDAVEVVTLSPR